MSECAWAEAHLPLARYGELDPDDAQRLSAHLLGCPACQEVRDGFETAASLLDELPLQRPAPERVAGLKARVLAAVGCPREAELFDAPDPEHLAACASCRDAQRAFAGVGAALDTLPVPALSSAQRAALEARVLAATGTAICEREAELLDDLRTPELAEHVAGCGACQAAEAAFLGVGTALDQVPLPTPSAERFAALKADVLAAVGEPVLAGASELAEPNPAGIVLRFPALISRLAAVFLVAVTLGMTGVVLVDNQSEHSRVAVLEQEADVLVRSGERGMIAPAIQRYEEVALHGDATQAARAREELAGLRILQGRVAPGVTAQGTDEEPVDILIGYEDVIVEFPGTRASLFGIKQALAREAREAAPAEARTQVTFNEVWRAPGQTIKYDIAETVTKNPQFERYLQDRLRNRPQILRFDYAGMNRLVNDRNLNNWRLRQSILLQQGLHAEELSVIASSANERDRYREQAREHFQKAVELAPDSKAGRLAQQALTRLI